LAGMKFEKMILKCLFLAKIKRRMTNRRTILKGAILLPFFFPLLKLKGKETALDLMSPKNRIFAKN
jgi:hypothetical protein